MEEEIKKAFKQHLKIDVKPSKTLRGDKALKVSLYWDDELITECLKCVDDD